MDLLTWPILGRFLRWRHARTAMQLPLLLIAALIVFDGLVGPQLAPKNLATVGVWLHYRGLVVLALLLAGNLFCMACPFMLPRQTARWWRERFGRGGRTVPAWLRGKWVAVGLVVLFFFCYELFDLWATPWWTAWLVVAYFLIAFAVDAVFRGAAFCKHVCPVGQFNFFGSLISPLEIKVREPSVCAGCRTKDCITAGNLGNSGNAGKSGNLGKLGNAGNLGDAGNPPSAVGGQAFSGQMPRAALAASRSTKMRRSTLSEAERSRRGEAERSRRGEAATQGAGSWAGINSGLRFAEQSQSPRPGARGCELWLFQERKAGNMDCTFCLDCIHACPYDNIGLIGRTPTAELWTDPFRSGVGRFSQRADLAALVAVFTFGAYLNALAMIRPIYALQEGLARTLRTGSEAPGLALIFLIGLVVIPAALLMLAGLATRALSRLRAVPLGRLIRRYVYSLVPMGFGMWLAHYGFHFLTGALTIVPVAQSFLADIGLYAGAPAWGVGPLVPAEWLFPIEALLLYLGAFGSIIVAFQIAVDELRRNNPSVKRRPTLGAVLTAAGPWMILTTLLLGFGLWIMLQPMEMRGTMQMVTGG